MAAVSHAVAFVQEAERKRRYDGPLWWRRARMKRRATAALALLAAIGATAAGPPPARVAQLGWLAGAWVEEKHGAWTEERWAPPRGGVMLGASLSGKGNRADDFEFTRIAADPNGTVDYWASV